MSIAGNAKTTDLGNENNSGREKSLVEVEYHNLKRKDEKVTAVVSATTRQSQAILAMAMATIIYLA